MNNIHPPGIHDNRRPPFIRSAALVFCSIFFSFSFAMAAASLLPASVDSDPFVQNRSTNPGLENLLPSLPFAVAEGTLTGMLSPTATSMRYNGEKTIGSIGLGFGYFKPATGRSMFGGQFELATMLGNRIATGTTLGFYSNRKDLVLNAIWQIPNSGFRIKASGGYLWGNQNFSFPSGDANIDLEQFSGSLSTQYIISDSGETSMLQSVGFSVWGAQANQKSGNPEPRTFIVETPTDHLIMSDPLKLSEGRLSGAAADVQFALRSNLVAKASLGYEMLRFPFSDGTREINESAYYSLQMFFEPLPELLLGASYKSGAGENRTSFSAETGRWLLNAFHTEGDHGVAGNNGVLLTCRLAIPAGVGQPPLARRMKPTRSSDTAALLADALERPLQLPTSFLAKVDPTAVTLVASISKGKAITGFAIEGQTGATIIDEAAHTIALNMPFNTDITALTPTITIRGSSVNPASGAERNFTGPVTYTVTADDGSTQDYTVRVTVAAADAKTITAFTIPGQTGPTIIDEAEHIISLTMPNGTDVSALQPVISINGTSVDPGSNVPQDFTNPVTYTVTASNGSLQPYTVTITVAADPAAKSITDFYISGQKDSAIIDENSRTIKVTMPYGTDVTVLWPTITITGVSVNPESDVPQDFTNPVAYTVRAADGSTRKYKVTVTVATSVAVGEYYGGGIVVFVDEKGINGLIVTTEDQSQNATWSQAKLICDNLEYGGFTDWHLPNRDELNKVFLFFKAGDITMSMPGAKYWSSESAGFPGTAYFLNLAYGLYYGQFISTDTQYTEAFIRAVRTF